MLLSLLYYYEILWGSDSTDRRLGKGSIESMRCSKRKGTTGKIEPSKQFLLEERIRFQRGISSIIQEHTVAYWDSMGRVIT